MPTPSTINELYEYRIANIVRKMIVSEHMPLSGEVLEYFLQAHSEQFASLILDDIQEYMGFDELLRQVKES